MGQRPFGPLDLCMSVAGPEASRLGRFAEGSGLGSPRKAGGDHAVYDSLQQWWRLGFESTNASYHQIPSCCCLSSSHSQLGMWHRDSVAESGRLGLLDCLALLAFNLIF